MDSSTPSHPSQIELLMRSAAGDPIWGGSTALDRLRRDLELLCHLGFIRPDPAGGRFVTPLGSQAAIHLCTQIAAQDPATTALDANSAYRSSKNEDVR